jgi:hypothetical protein
MTDQRYWSIEDCGWVKLPPREAIEAEADAIPAQREDELVQEPVDA